MTKSPFKGLDAFEKEDFTRFFGRSREVNEIFNRVLGSKVTLLYGLSGTGKSSIVKCGLANCFHEEEWLPVYIRRGKNIELSLKDKLVSAWETMHHSITSPSEEYDTIEIYNPSERLESSVEKLVEEVSDDLYMPIFLIFDQFEELFTINPFHPKQQQSFNETALKLWITEKTDFYQTIRRLIDSKKFSVKIIFIIREEWWGHLNDFERVVPELNQNRMRIEKMNTTVIEDVIKKTVKFSQTEEGFHKVYLGKQGEGKVDFLTKEIVKNVRDKKDHTIDLTDLQIYLDRLLKNHLKGDYLIITEEVIGNNKMNSVLDDFLTETLRKIEDDLISRWRKDASSKEDEEILRKKVENVPLNILSRMVTDDKTKRATKEEELLDDSYLKRREISKEDIQYCLERMLLYKLINSENI